MSRRLRWFLGVGISVTGLDLAIFLGLASTGLVLVVADLVALVLASTVSFWAHRRITRSQDHFAQIDHKPLAFMRVLWPSLLVDLVVVTLLGADKEALLILGLVKLTAVGLAALVRLLTYRRVLYLAVRESQTRDSRRSPLAGEIRLSVVLPSYQAESLVEVAISEVREAMSAELDEGELEIVVVDDGSADNTSGVAQEAGADRVVTLEKNLGKGGAVRAGMLAARGRTVVFTDVDLAYPPHQIVAMLHAIEDGADAAVGNRRHLKSETIKGAGGLRNLGSSVFNLLTYVVLLGSYRDTQCGLKAFRRDVARLVFSQSRLDGFAMDVEILHLVERHRLSLVELPVHLLTEDTSTISLFTSAIDMIRDVIRVRRWAGRGAYELTPGTSVSEQLEIMASV